MLGVGDRHLDNLLLTRLGQLVHVDFGFVLGQDPKPFYHPVVRICPEMLAALGPPSSPYHAAFLLALGACYCALRRRASALLALLALHRGEGLTDLGGRQSAEQAFAGVAARLRLDVGDAEAAAHMRATVLEVRCFFCFYCMLSCSLCLS